MDRISAAALINEINAPLRLAGKPFTVIENAWPFVNNDQGKQLQQLVNKTTKTTKMKLLLTTKLRKMILLPIII